MLNVKHFKMTKLKYINASKVSKNRQIFLPKEVVEKLQLEPGDYVGFFLNSNEDIIIRKMRLRASAAI